VSRSAIYTAWKKKMKVNATTGAVIGGLNQRRGTIIDSDVREDEFTCIAEVALNDMFGYSNQLRGSTQGKGQLLRIYPFTDYSRELSCFSGEFSMVYKVGDVHLIAKANN
jgi:hypothetical protein